MDRGGSDARILLGGACIGLGSLLSLHTHGATARQETTVVVPACLFLVHTSSTDFVGLQATVGRRVGFGWAPCMLCGNAGGAGGGAEGRVRCRWQGEMAGCFGRHLETVVLTRHLSLCEVIPRLPGPRLQASCLTRRDCTPQARRGVECHALSPPLAPGHANG